MQPMSVQTHTDSLLVTGPENSSITMLYYHLADAHIHWDEENELHKYIVALYWVVTTISSVG